MTQDIYALLSDNHALKYLPFKRLRSLAEADTWLKSALISLHCGRNYLHFICTKNDDRIIGFIDVISPKLAKEHYHLTHYPYFIEFCIKTEFSHRKLMSSLLPEFLASLSGQQRHEIAAVTDRKNISAQKLLIRSGFRFDSPFDLTQDFYLYTSQQFKVA